MSAFRPLLTTLLAAAALAGCRSLAPEVGLNGPAEASFGTEARGLRPMGTAGALQIGSLTTDGVRHAAIAHNPLDDQYLGVWEEQRGDRTQVYARRLDAGLHQLVGPKGRPLVALGAPEGEQLAPAVAFDGQAYVAAWQAPDGGLSMRRIDRQGAPLDAPTRLGGAGAREVALAAAPGLAPLAAWSENGGIMASPLGASASVALSERTGGFFGLGAGPAGEQPAVAVGLGRYGVAWAEGGTVKARTLDASGAPGPLLTLGPGHAPAIAAAGQDGFAVAFEQGGRVAARLIGADGAPGPTLELGAGVGAAIAYDGGAGRYVAVWRDGAHMVRQHLSASLAPIGAIALVPSAGARRLGVVYNANLRESYVLAEERLYGFDRASVIKLK